MKERIGIELRGAVEWSQDKGRERNRRDEKRERKKAE